MAASRGCDATLASAPSAPARAGAEGAEDPPDQNTVEACHAGSKGDFLPLPELIEQFGELGYDVVEMVLADQDSWDRYRAAQWLNIRRRLDRNPDDELAAAL